MSLSARGKILLFILDPVVYMYIITSLLIHRTIQQSEIPVADRVMPGYNVVAASKIQSELESTQTTAQSGLDLFVISEFTNPRLTRTYLKENFF